MAIRSPKCAPGEVRIWLWPFMGHHGGSTGLYGKLEADLLMAIIKEQRVDKKQGLIQRRAQVLEIKEKLQKMILCEE